MSDVTTEQLLDIIQRNGGARALDLANRDLTGIDLSGELLEELLDEQGYGDGAGRRPAWFEPWTKGVSLSRSNLQGAQLRMADLRNACLEGADLRSADLAGSFLQDATLEEANLQGANLTGAVLSHTVLWAKFPSLEGAFLYGANIEFVPCTQEQFGKGIGEEVGRDWRRARDAYLSLRHNFLDLGRYGDASWAYRKERRMERATHFPSEEGERWMRDELGEAKAAPGRSLAVRARRWTLLARLYLRPMPGIPLRRAAHLGNWLQDAVCEYGENPWRLMAWAVALGLVGALAGFAIDLLAASALVLPQPAGFLDYLGFSFASMATMHFARTEPAGQLGVLLATAQAMLGVSLFGLFMYTLGRRMSGN